MTQPPLDGPNPPEQNQPPAAPPPPPVPPVPPAPGGAAPAAPPPGAPSGPPPGAPAGPPPGYPPPGQAGPPPGYQPPPGAPGGPPPGAPAAPPPGYAPPPGGYPPPPAGGYPPPGGYPPQGQPPASSLQFDASKATTNDWIVMGAGVVLFLFSFFGWRSWSTGVLGLSYSIGAWNQYWWLATVAGLAVAVVVALRVLFGQPLPQIKPAFLVYGAAGGFLITLIVLIQNFAMSYGGPGFGIWVCLIVSAAQTYFVWTWAQNQPGWTLPRLPGGVK